MRYIYFVLFLIFFFVGQSLAQTSKVSTKASVEPYFAFSISGIKNNTPVNTGNETGCKNKETTNTGIDSTSTKISLGKLNNTPDTTNTKIKSIAAQTITITTNALNGYVLSASSNSGLKNKTGFEINSSTTPQSFQKETSFFGIHPCGLDVDLSEWVEEGKDSFCNTFIDGSSAVLCKYSWPNPGDPVILASDPTGPIGDNIQKGNGIVSIEYAAGVDNAIQGGNYSTKVTYTVVPTF